ncbi:MAG: aminotransferase class I/II-fold pyridoxal phosphate-dependent enzyme [Bdellovibrionales bacterium]|nr:aminotransferase class I/II-fold pyridoxal phosphate-dependent enzyme [Bdellovibrionales bacterium]
MNIQLSQRIQTTGKYAFAAIDEKVAELQSQGVKVIDFGVGDPKTPPPSFVIEHLNQFAEKRKTTGYPSYIGSKEFRQACADYMKREFDIALNVETEICSTIGSKEAVFHFPLTLVDEGDVVICPSPGYPPYKNGTRFAGGTVYTAPLLEENKFLIDFESIPQEICDKAKIIWINYPNSPTGAMATDDWYKQLIAWARKNNIVIAADEGCYIEIYFDKKPKSILAFGKEGIITFYSMSKRNNMTMFRSGFVAGDEKLVAAFKKVKTNIDSGTPTFIQDVSALALQDTNHIEGMRKEYDEKRAIILSAFEKKGLPLCKSDSTFYIWQKAPQGKTGEDLANSLVDIGIVVIPGAAISDATASGINPGQNYVRLALVPTLDEIKEAAKRIAEELVL